MPKAYTVKESIEKNKQLNEDAKCLCEYFKNEDPELAELIKNDISLMPSDAIIVNNNEKTKIH